MDARPWLLWVLSAAAVAMTARNPLYAALLIGVAVVMRLGFGRPERPGGAGTWRLGLLVVTLSGLYGAAFIHTGRTVLFNLPPWPLVGGNITLEAVVAGATNGLTLLALIGMFLTFNAIVPAADLVRLVPAGLRDAGVVLLIGINFLPETTRQFRRIKEAQAVRGHQIRVLADWRPIVVPLVVGGLGRAMQVAETMVARGYGAVEDRESSPLERAGLIVALLFGLAGWVVGVWRGPIGWLLLAPAITILGILLWHRGRVDPRRAHRARTWAAVEYLLLLGALTALAAVFLPLPGVDRGSLAYAPFPRLSWPQFDAIIGLALMALAAPVIALGIRRLPSAENVAR
jgi:energy-coupling factor transport system permease protein